MEGHARPKGLGTRSAESEAVLGEMGKETAAMQRGAARKRCEHSRNAFGIDGIV